MTIYKNEGTEAVGVRQRDAKGYAWTWVEPEETIDLPAGTYAGLTRVDVKAVSAKQGTAKIETKRKEEPSEEPVGVEAEEEVVDKPKSKTKSKNK